jgi:hypothetical protein
VMVVASLAILSVTQWRAVRALDAVSRDFPEAASALPAVMLA